MAAIVPGLGIGARVLVKDREGTVRFMGNTEFASGKWVGIELDTPDGKNSGSVQEKHYFDCQPNHGLFVRQSQLTVLVPAAEEYVPTSPSASTAATPQPIRTPTRVSPRPTTPASSRLFTPRTPATVALSTPSPVQQTPQSTPMQATEPSTATTAGDSGEAQTLRLALEELGSKYKSLEAQREADAIQLKELDRLRAVVEQHVAYKTQWQQQRKEKDEALREMERAIKEIEGKYSDVDVQIAEAHEAAEMATLDKEMAEEQAELLRQENQQLREQIEALQLDMDILRAEAEAGVGVGEGGEHVNTQHVRQLETQLERHRDALCRLRDLAAAEKTELTNQVKALEKEVAGTNEIAARNVGLVEEVKELERQVDELKELVDDARAAEELVHQLTDKNLAMEDRVRELEESVRDLEALQAMADEVDEQHAAINKQLTTDLDFARAQLAEKDRQMQLVDDEFAEYEQTIAKYRTLIAALQQNAATAGSGSSVSANEDSQRVASLQLQLQATSAKAQARAIDAELRALDLAQARCHAALLAAYLPAAFSRVDEGCVQAVLLLDRLAYKADTLVTHVNTQYTHQAQVAPDLRLCAARIAATAHHYLEYVRGIQWRVAEADEQTLMVLAENRDKLAAGEAVLDGLVAMLRAEELNAHVSTDSLDMAAAKCRDVMEKLPPAAPMRVVRGILGEWAAMLTLLEAEASSAALAVDGGDDMVSELMTGLRSVQSQLAKELGRLPADRAALDLVGGKWVRGDELRETAEALQARCSPVKTAVDTIRAWARTAMKEGGGGKNASGLAAAAPALLDAMQEAMALVSDSMATVGQLACTGLEQHPSYKRAEHVCREYGDAAGLKELMDIKEEEVLDLATRLKIKEKELEEDRARSNLLKARGDQMLGEVQRMAEMERRLVVAQDTEAKLKEAMEALEDDLDRLHRENAYLKRSLRQKGGVATGPHTPGTPARPGIRSPGPDDLDGMSLAGTPQPFTQPPSHGHAHVAQAQVQVQALHMAVRALRAENARLRSEAARRGLAGLPSLPVLERSASAKAAALSTTAVQLVQDMHVISGGARVVAVDHGRGKLELQAQRDRLKALQAKSMQLAAQGARVMADVTTNPSQFRPFPPSDDTSGTHIGRITLPLDPGSSLLAHRSVALDHARFTALHTVFAS